MRPEPHSAQSLMLLDVLRAVTEATMQLVSIVLSGWDTDVSEAHERQGSRQHLRLSRLTKGFCNCWSWATDCTAAVNVSGYNGRSWGARGQKAPVKAVACGLGGYEVSPFTGAVWSRLGFPVAFASLCQLSKSARTKWLLQQLSGKTALRPDQCLYKAGSSAFCPAHVLHSYELWCCCFSFLLTLDCSSDNRRRSIISSSLLPLVGPDTL